jgi:hypothetical protein
MGTRDEARPSIFGRSAHRIMVSMYLVALLANHSGD